MTTLAAAAEHLNAAATLPLADPEADRAARIAQASCALALADEVHALVQVLRAPQAPRISRPWMGDFPEGLKP